MSISNNNNWLQQLPVPWTEIQSVLQILSHYNLEDYIPVVLQIIYHPQLHELQVKKGIFHLTCSQLISWAQQWLPESFFALTDDPSLLSDCTEASLEQQIEGKVRKEIFLHFLEEQCISGEILVVLLRHFHMYNLLPMTSTKDTTNQSYHTMSSSLQSTNSEVSQTVGMNNNDEGVMQNEIDDQLTSSSNAAAAMHPASDEQEKEKENLPLSYFTVVLLQLICSSWLMGIKHAHDFALDEVPITVLTGNVTDLTSLPPLKAKKLMEVDQQAARTGEGYYYGQLLVLGYTEYRQVDKKWLPFGLANQKFVLKRRKLANGLKVVDTYVKHSTQPFNHNPFYMKNPLEQRSSFVPPNFIRNVRHLQPHHLTLQFGPIEDVGNLVDDAEAMRSNSDEFNTPSPMRDEADLDLDSDEEESDAEEVDPSTSFSSAYPPNDNAPLSSPSSAGNEIVFEYVSDPLHDMFQLGRAVNSTNDFIIPGQLHLSDDGNYTSPVSRWACRIVCERLPPFRSFIYAGGFSDLQSLKVKGMDYDGDYDGFTTYGVRIYQPEIKEWLEVSVLGNMFEPRLVISEIPTYPDIRKTTELGNELTNGTLIDFCGVYLMFQDPIVMANQVQTLNPRDIIDQLNAQKPQCPVLFTDIKFSYRDAKERAQNVVEKLDQDVDLTQSYGRYRPIHIPIVDYSDVNEENRSYVFPSCGHVHGYHKSLEHHACPLCRTYGSFVPIAFAFEPSLNMATCTQSEDASSQGPTHVFNPCGHVASLATCEYWSDLKVFCKQFYTPSQFLPRNNPTHADQHGNPFDPIEYHAICPFCCTELHPRKPFSRLILQAEQGFAWEQNDADQADISLTSPMQATAASWDNESYRQQYLTSQRLLFQREFGERQTRSDGKNHPVGLFRSLHFPSICCPDSSHHE